jgi:transcriptional regulator with XRE-family HTH domain
MILADRLRELRLQKKLSQGDIQNRSGLLRCYISRVENGYTVPSFQTLEKLSRALEVPMYQFFYDGAKPPKPPNRLRRQDHDSTIWGNSGSDARLLADLRRVLSRLDDRKLDLLYSFACDVVKRKVRPSR